MKVWAAYDEKGLIEVFTAKELAEKAHPAATVVERDLHGFLTAHEDLRPHHNIPLPKIPWVFPSQVEAKLEEI